MLVKRRLSAHKTQHDPPGSKGSAAFQALNSLGQTQSPAAIPAGVPDSRVARTAGPRRSASAEGGGSKARWYASSGPVQGEIAAHTGQLCLDAHSLCTSTSPHARNTRA